MAVTQFVWEIRWMRSNKRLFAQFWHQFVALISEGCNINFRGFMKVHNSVSVCNFFAFDIWSLFVIFDRVNFSNFLLSKVLFCSTIQFKSKATKLYNSPSFMFGNLNQVKIWIQAQVNLCFTTDVTTLDIRKRNFSVCDHSFYLIFFQMKTHSH